MALKTALNSGQWLVAIFRVQDGILFLDRTAMDFPKSDIDGATRLFVENLMDLKTQT